MRPPAFWHGPRHHPAALALAPLGALYGHLSAARMDRSGRRGARPVICLGNFTLGGAGKTPAALALAAILLRELGRRPVFLSRGYGGRLAGPVQVDPARHGFTETGDEPLLLARAAPAVVSRDRVAGAALCAAIGDVVVMDDGLQNPDLAKDLALAVVDAGIGPGNGRPFPAGPLRAPLARQWPHVAGLILVGSGAPGERVAAQARARGLPVHRAVLEPEGGSFAGRRVLAFAGIGRPDKFFASLVACGADLAGTRAFADHHP